MGLLARVPALDKHAADERDHLLTMLVHAGVVHGDHAPARAVVQRPGLDHLAAVRHGIADIDRLEPLQVAEARRRSELGDRFAARPPFVVFAPATVDQQPHPDAGGVPPRGAEPAEVRARRGVVVDMERLRIEALREGLDVLGGEDVAADLDGLADADVLEELHVGWSAGARMESRASVRRALIWPRRAGRSLRSPARRRADEPSRGRVSGARSFGLAALDARFARQRGAAPTSP